MSKPWPARPRNEARPLGTPRPKPVSKRAAKKAQKGKPEEDWGPEPGEMPARKAQQAKANLLDSGAKPGSSPHDLNVQPEPALAKALDHLNGIELAGWNQTSERLEISSPDSQKVVDSATQHDVVLSQAIKPTETAAEAAVKPAPGPKEQTVTLTFKGLSKNGKQAIYAGARTNIRIATASFEGQPAESLEVSGDGLLGVKQPKAKLTPEERKAANAAKPKPTLAEKAAKAKERADKLAALAAQEAQGGANGGAQANQ